MLNKIIMQFSLEEVKSAFEYAKKEKGNFESWLNNYKKTLTKNDKDLFNFLEISKVYLPNKNIHFNLIKWTGVGGGWDLEPIKKFKDKYFNERVEFYPVRYNDCELIISDRNFFNDDNFENCKEYDGLYRLDFEVNGCKIIILDTYDLDETLPSFLEFRKQLEESGYMYWKQSFCIYLSEPHLLDFKPVVDLF
jgi:hypothetical protein